MRVLPFTGCYTADFTIKLNQKNGVYTIHAGNMDCTIDPLEIECESTLIVCNPSLHLLYPLYDFHHLCDIFHVTAKEFPSAFRIYGIMQIDKYGDFDVTAKVFLPRNQYTLESDTDDYAGLLYRDIGKLQEVDLESTYHIENLTAKREADEFVVNLDLVVSPKFLHYVFINYAGQCRKLYEGNNTVRFKYVIGNRHMYTGNAYSTYMGRMVEVPKHVREDFHDT